MHICSTTDPVYDAPDDLELKQVNKPSNSPPHTNERPSHRQKHKEEVDIRYEKSVLASNVETKTNTRTNKQQTSPSHTSHKLPSNQTGEERIYQPLVPVKTYKGPQETSAYQDLAFETREPEGGVVNNSDGQYDVVKQKGANAYEPLSFGRGGSKEGQYQPLTFRGEESNIYQHPQNTPRV